VRTDTASGVSTSRRVLLGVGIGVLAVAAVVLVVMLVRDAASGAAKVPSAQEEAQEFAKLKAEAGAAAENLFNRIDEAYSTGNPALLDGVYLPNSKIAETQRGFIRDEVARGEVRVAKARSTDVRVESIDRLAARVTLVRTITQVEVRDAKTGR
jgi:hypothetical protein